MFNSGFRSLSKFGFKCSGIQQRGTVILDSMSFEALSCQGVSESESQPTERLYDVLPNQQGHQVLYRTT